MKTINEFTVINSLRTKCADVINAAGSLNQAVKALAGLSEKYPEIAEALGVENFGFKSVSTAWADTLRVDVNGKQALALYMSETAKVSVTDEKTGEPKDANMYERVVNKKGVVSFKSVKLRTLTAPEKWTPALIIEGLIQSTMLGLAKKESEVAEKHRDELLAAGDVYVKKSTKGADGSVTVTFEKA